ncbi:excinuclease ABC subunit C [Candidatus Woesebacteria bacterium RIFCSPHIGHO2_01_FULL_41_10]|uniref:Excinuclease ABC subunit C n=1 Tax=Candidatus Woesebacteria bacterium RIFCSPHIGHO2_01_FULL_41_10 TaxID=1802500 RepID=A0A1F7YT36_9BACT|nr:MAG: excinuclease ABC subunit C [Candidatus Woesebacteria bacterium RIFCSPHIGHO2_01_FULL_41_10]
MFFYTYVLQSKKDGYLYIGWTNNLRKRFDDHNLGNVEATKSRVPFEIIYYEACKSKQNAIAREKQLKSGYGRRYLKTRM